MPRGVLFQFRAESRAFAAALRSSTSQLRQLDQATAKAAAGMSRMGGAFTRAGRRGSSLSSKITAVATSFNALATAARVSGAVARRTFGTLGAVVQGTVGEFSEFDALSRQISASMGLGTKAAGAMDRKIISLGIQTEFTIKQMQQAALAIAQLGASKKELGPLLEKMSAVATVTGTDLPRVAEIAKSAMNAFGLEVKDIGRLSALLIQAHTQSGATIERLAQGLQNAGGVARGFGQEIQDVVPLLQALISGGLEAGKAGNALKVMMAVLGSQSSQLAKKLQGTTLNMKELDPASGKLIDIVKKLREANLSAAQAFDIFGRRGATGVLMLTRLSKDGLKAEEVLRRYQKGLGQVAEAEAKAAKVRSGLRFNLLQLEAAFSAGRIIVGKFATELLNLDGVTGSSAKRLVGLVDQLSRLKSSEFKEIIVRVLSPKNLATLWKQAAEGVFPAMSRVMGASLMFGARQLVRFAPAIGYPMARGFLKSFGGPAVKVFTWSGKFMVGALREGSVLLLRAVAAAFNDVPGIGPSIRKGADKASTQLIDAANAWQKGIGDGGKVLETMMKTLANDLGKTPAELLKQGEISARNIFGKAGTFGGIVDASRKAAGEWNKLVRQGARVVQPVLDQARVRQLEERATRPGTISQRSGAPAGQLSDRQVIDIMKEIAVELKKPSTVNNTVNDHRVQTNYGARSRKAVRGPRENLTRRRLPGGGTTR